MTLSEENDVKLLAVYGRTSTSAQEVQETIKTQLSAVYDFAKGKGYTIAQEYIDEGWSGDTLARPALDKLRQDVREKIWDAVLIYDPDRLARRYSYQELVMDELKEAGVEVLFVTTPSPKNSEDKILHGVRGLFAEYERAKISERFRLGKIRKVKEGHLLVSEALYGYTYIPKNEDRHGYYEINPEEARVVTKIFTWVAKDRLTIRKIVRRLQELGIKPRRSKRGVWNTSTISNLLRNRAYIGEARWGSSYAVVPENPINTDKYRKTKKSSRRKKPKEEWITISVPSIIDKKLFDRARSQLEANFALCQRNKKNEYLLAGRIQCECGRKRTGEGPQKGKHLYYRCTDRVLSFPLPPTCKEKGINARIADKVVWNKIAALMSSPDLLSKQIERWMRSQRVKAKSSYGDVEAMEKEIEKLTAEEERYNKAYGAGVFTIEKLKEYTVPLREKISALKSQIERAEEESNQIKSSMLPNKTEMRRFAKEAVKKLESLSFESKREIVLSVIEKVVGTQQRLQVYGYIPITNHVEFKTISRNCWIAKCW